MATLLRIAFFLACALFLHAQINSASGDESGEDAESYKEEMKLVKDKTGYVMGVACDALKEVGIDCEVGDVGRRFMGKIAIDINYSFKHAKLRILYALTYISEKIVKCVFNGIRRTAATFVSSLSPCLKNGFFALNNFFKTTLQVITGILRTVYNFAKEVAGCRLSLLECIKKVFDNIFSSVMKIIKSIISNSKDIIVNLLGFNKSECPEEKKSPAQRPAPSPAPSPKKEATECSGCIYCALYLNQDFCKHLNLRPLPKRP